MIIVDNIFVPRHLLTARFSCPYETCGSMCCVSGDRGAPATREEILAIEEKMTRIKPGMDPDCLDDIKQSGISESEDNNHFLKCLGNDQRCVFSVKTPSGVTCQLEIVSEEDSINTLRPVSCRLFPIRIRRYNGIVILDYEIWEECRDAWNTGDYLLDFCRTGLVETFGQEWVDRLDTVRQSVIEAQTDSF